jgi:hypothetical protein
MAHKVLLSLMVNQLGILVKAENGVKESPLTKLLYTTLHGLCKHAKVGPCSKKVTYVKEKVTCSLVSEGHIIIMDLAMQWPCDDYYSGIQATRS